MRDVALGPGVGFVIETCFSPSREKAFSGTPIANCKLMQLFAYGTLMDTAVWRRVVGRETASRAAILDGFSRKRLHGVVYPGVVLDPEGMVRGKLYRSIGPRELLRIDAYEGDWYQRCDLPVRLPDGHTERALVYVLKTEQYWRASDEWNPRTMMAASCSVVRSELVMAADPDADTRRMT